MSVQGLGSPPPLDGLRSGGRRGDEPDTIRIVPGGLEGEGQNDACAERVPGIRGRVSGGTPEAPYRGPPRPNLHRVKARWLAQPCVSTGVGPRAPCAGVEDGASWCGGGFIWSSHPREVMAQSSGQQHVDFSMSSGGS